MSATITLTRDIAACQAIRHEVFVREQNVTPAEEIDGLDEKALHLLALRDGVPVGTARILIYAETGKIGRVAVLREARGTGLGRSLILAALARLRREPGVTRAQLGAQCHALGFYERLGFAAYGPEYLDAGIAHRDMALDLP